MRNLADDETRIDVGRRRTARKTRTRPEVPTDGGGRCGEAEGTIRGRRGERTEEIGIFATGAGLGINDTLILF